MRVLRPIHLVVAWAFVAGVVGQVFLAGLGVFDDPATFLTHANWGYTLEGIAFVLFALAAAGRLGRRQLIYAAGLFGMIIVQSILVAMRREMPVVAALHPVNGFAILLVGIAMAREAWAARESRTPASAVTAQAAGATAGR
jgi:hypothetical protein